MKCIGIGCYMQCIGIGLILENEKRNSYSKQSLRSSSLSLKIVENH